MIRVTLDTNILVSGTFWTGDSYRILELIDKKKITSILSKEIIAEYINTVISEEITEKIENKKLIAAKTAQKVVMMSEIVEPTRKIDRIKEDPEDNKILECATRREFLAGMGAVGITIGMPHKAYGQQQTLYAILPQPERLVDRTIDTHDPIGNKYDIGASVYHVDADRRRRGDIEISVN